MTSVQTAPAATATEFERRPLWGQIVVYIFIIGPILGLLFGIGLAIAGHGITWLDVGLAVVMYAISGHGITAGYHRLFTHGAFKANRPLKIGLAVAGSYAVEGSVIQWVADHRKHHKYADQPGDPHSPWRYGTSTKDIAKGLWWAHCGWLFDRDTEPNMDKYAPDLQADPDLVKINSWFPAFVLGSFFIPPIIAFAVTGGSWWAALTALVWASVVRILLLHHVTWSTNSICHMFGERPFKSRDKATNFWPLGLISMGESWHNMHHAEPTSPRMGVDRGQVDTGARLIWLFEKFGWATDVRWPKQSRIEAKRIIPTQD